MQTAQEVELKYRLESNKDFEKVKKALGEPKASVKGVFRIRTIENEKKAFMTHKCKGKMSGDGISSVEESEQEVDYEKSKEAVKDTCVLNSWENVELLNKVKSMYSISEFKSLGGIFTTRRVYDYEGHKLELDESDYGFAINYEIEIETEKPEEIKKKLLDWLNGLNVEFAPSKASKFVNFISGKIIR